MKLNLGCGEFPLAGYCNVDIRSLPGVDVVADIRTIDFTRDPISHIYAGHVIEHLPMYDATLAIEGWWNLLGPGGDLTVVIPDVDKALSMWSMRLLSVADFLLIVGGEQDIPEMRHQSAWSMRSLWHVLSDLDDCEVILMDADTRAPANPPWQTILKAWKKHNVRDYYPTRAFR